MSDYDEANLVMVFSAIGAPSEAVPVNDGPGPRCLRCTAPTPNGAHFCLDCRRDVWQWAESMAAGEAEVNLLVLGKLNDWRRRADGAGLSQGTGAKDS